MLCRSQAAKLAKTLAQGCCPILTILNLRRNAIGDAGARALALAFGATLGSGRAALPGLETIMLSFNDIGYDGLAALDVAFARTQRIDGHEVPLLPKLCSCLLFSNRCAAPVPRPLETGARQHARVQMARSHEWHRMTAAHTNELARIGARRPKAFRFVTASKGDAKKRESIFTGPVYAHDREKTERERRENEAAQRKVEQTARRDAEEAARHEAEDTWDATRVMSKREPGSFLGQNLYS
jgi:hypothetical protein